jgi:hypothetical protein
MVHTITIIIVFSPSIIISRAIAAKIPTDSNEDSSSEEEAEEPKKMSGRYCEEVVKSTPYKSMLLERRISHT